MALAEDLSNEVATILKENWTKRDAYVVPEPESLALGNHAALLNATVLYADLADSTDLVQSQKAHFAAEVYKCYLHCAAKIIRAEGGSITAFDGDRVMGVFVGDSKNAAAARCALKVNHAVTQIVTPLVQKSYSTDFTVKHAVGVDTSELLVARTGIRGSNDLVWVGRAANYAAKLSAFRDGSFASWITGDVFDDLPTSVRESSGKPMWEQRTWTARNVTVYRSNWRWKV